MTTTIARLAVRPLRVPLRRPSAPDVRNALGRPAEASALWQPL